MTSSKDKSNAFKEEFVNKLHFSEITSNTYILKGEQVLTLGIESWCPLTRSYVSIISELF